MTKHAWNAPVPILRRWMENKLTKTSLNRFRRFFPFQRSNIRKRTDEKKVSRLLRRQKNEKQGERNRWERKKGKKLTKKGQQTERRKETERAISLFYCGRNSKKGEKNSSQGCCWVSEIRRLLSTTSAAASNQPWFDLFYFVQRISNSIKVFCQTLSLFLSAAIGQRPRNYLSCRCCCSCCSSQFGSFPH